MIKKIISGGQTGADRAALDVALKFNIDHGGWIPKGRLTENGPLPLKYRLEEMNTSHYAARTKKNIQESDGTLLVTRGILSGGSLLTRNLATELNCPVCHIDLLQMEEFEAALISNTFLADHAIGILNVAGPRLSQCPGIDESVKAVLEVMLYLVYLDHWEACFIENDIDFSIMPAGMRSVQTIQEALEQITSDLSIREKVFIARLEESRIGSLYFLMLDYIKYRLNLDGRDQLLMKSICRESDTPFMSIEDGVMVIVKHLKQSLEKDYMLKVIK